MSQRTVRPPTTEEHEPYPLDVETMRDAARRLLAGDAAPLTADELNTLTVQLRSHVALAVPEVEALALALPEDDVPRACAFACTGEARYLFTRLADESASGPLTLAKHLARVVNALCDHYENLGGGENGGSTD
ncbi:DUF6415 family natural product biosynthesis protein [Streptomyces sp. NPDC050743]|uniref:DUF6415 family natural product biosynthesis protein n=1 Tax=Streptomyces sp. NPDC050743 TaxID=3365634 RepID=UPI0037909834